MGQTRDEITPHLAERVCWQVARRDDSRVARRLYRKQAVDGVYRLDEGAVLDDVFHCLRAIGVMTLLEEAHGTAIQREMVPLVPYILLDGLKTLVGMESRKALPTWLVSDEALRRLVGCNAQQVRQGIGRRGATKRQVERVAGPRCPDTLAKNSVKWHVRDLEAVFNGAIRALAKAGVFGAKVTGLAEGTALETTERYRGCGQATRKVRMDDKDGQRHDMEGTVYGWTVLLRIEAVTKMPWAVTVGPLQDHEALWARALVTQARMPRAGTSRLATVVFDQGFWDGTTRWWLDQQGLRFVVPATPNMAVTAAARAQAAAGEGITMDRRVHTGRHGQGKTAWPARQATAVGGVTALTT